MNETTVISSKPPATFGETVHPKTARGLGIEWIGTLLVFILINYGVFYAAGKHWTPLSISGGYVNYKWRLLLEQKAPLEWMFVGDSMGLVGLSPEVFSKKSDGISLNLCTTAHNIIFNDVWLIETHIQRLGPPKHVVILHRVSTWSANADNYEASQIPLTIWQWAHLDPSPRIPSSEIFHALLARYVPLYLPNYYLGSLQMPKMDLPVYRFDMKGGQEQVMPIDPTIQRPTNSKTPVYDFNNDALSSNSREMLKKVSGLADRYNFDVFIVNQPWPEEWMGDTNFQRYIREFQDNMTAFTSGMKKVHYLSKPIAIPLAQFFDTEHVLYDGAKVYSKKIFNEIETRP